MIVCFGDDRHETAVVEFVPEFDGGTSEKCLDAINGLGGEVECCQDIVTNAFFGSAWSDTPDIADWDGT